MRRSRHRLVAEIMEHQEKLDDNPITVVYLLATMNDKRLTIFHKDYLKQTR